MIKVSIAQVRPNTGAWLRLLLALAVWRKRLVARQRRRDVDRLSGHMLRDIGFSRWAPERRVTDRLYRG
ncbi:MAG TPA: hypothetical protein VJV39_26800 [Dongiaceae bacterium]|nr:hypothetical protein [Dongiaceae bacterium]